MAELASPLRYNVPTPVFAPQPARIDQTLAPAPVVDTRKNSKAALFGTIAEVIAKLPETMLEAYMRGRQAKTGLQVRREFEQTPQDQRALAGLKGNSQGHVAVDPVDAELRKAQLDAYGRRAVPTPTQGQTLFNDLSQRFNGAGPLSAVGAPPAAAAAATVAPKASGTVSGSVFGLVPDGKGGWMDDPNDITDAGVKGFSATKGKWGADIKDPNLAGVAISPAQLKDAGIDWHDRAAVAAHRVKVIRPDGTSFLYPIVDALGTPGRVDFTAKAYQEVGGPMNKGGGLIEGLKYEIVPATAEAVPEERRAEISAAANQAGLALSNIAPESLTAANAPGPVPAANLPLANMPVRRPTIGRDPSTGAMIYAPTPTDVKAVFPSGTAVDISPPASASKEEVGKFYPSIEAIRADGIDPEGAEPIEGGGWRVKSYKSLGADERGRAKITDTQQNKLGGVLAMTQDFTELSDMHKKLYEQGKAGVQIGTGVEMFKKLIGKGSPDYVSASGKLDISKFKITRALNGSGVLTDRDFERAQAAAPALWEDPDQFNAKLGVVKSYLAEDLRNWISVNKESATEGQLSVAQEALDALTAPPDTAPGVAGLDEAMAKPAQQAANQDQEALKWLQANPNDPNAPLVRAKLKAKGISP